MQTVLFYLFSILMVASAFGVVINRSPVASALCLVVTFLGLAALFVQLDAFFIGIMQVLVYAGAVMVLFLFIIMLLDLKVENKKRFKLPVLGAGILVALSVAWQVAAVTGTLTDGNLKKPDLDFAKATATRSVQLGTRTSSDFIFSKISAKSPSLPDTHLFGEAIFTRFNLHLQVVGTLLLVATLGVVVLSKRKLR